MSWFCVFLGTAGWKLHGCPAGHIWMGMDISNDVWTGRLTHKYSWSGGREGPYCILHDLAVISLISRAYLDLVGTLGFFY